MTTLSLHSDSNPPRRPARPRPAARGASLVELMVGLAVGCMVIVVACTLFISVAAANRSAMQVGDMLDMSRLALDEMAFDATHAGYYGKAQAVNVLRGPGPDGATTLAIADLPVNDCAADWTADLQADLVIEDQVATLDCVPARWLPDTDVLAIKRAGGPAAALADLPSLPADALYVAADPLRGLLFAGTAADPSAVVGADAEIRPLVGHIYYVSTESDVPGTASTLRRMTLAGGPTYRDVELVPGVEDLQVECGVDVDGDGSVDAYVAPTATGGNRIVALRISLLIHALERDGRYVDNGEYGSLGTAQPRVTVAQRRRMQFSRTVVLRNAL